MARLPDAARVKAAVWPISFYTRELPGMPTPRVSSGWTSGGLCPFHNDSHSGNFRIHLDSGAYHCFACGAKGADVIAFVQHRLGLSFPSAVREIADAFGVRP